MRGWMSGDHDASRWQSQAGGEERKKKTERVGSPSFSSVTFLDFLCLRVRSVSTRAADKKQTNPQCLFAFVHHSAYPLLHAGGPRGRWDNARARSWKTITQRRETSPNRPEPLQQISAYSSHPLVVIGRCWSVKTTSPRLYVCVCVSPILPLSLSLHLPLGLTQPHLSPINPTAQDPLARPPGTARRMTRCPGPLPRRTP